MSCSQKNEGKKEENLIDAPTGNGTELNGRKDIGDRNECNLNDPYTQKEKKKSLPAAAAVIFLSKLEHRKKVKKETH